MKNLSVIASVVYVLICGIYFMLGKDDVPAWSVLYYVNNSLYICLLLLDNAIKSQNKSIISFLITSIIFQVLFIIFELSLIIWLPDKYFEVVINMFWSYVWFFLVVGFIITYNIINKWENG